MIPRSSASTNLFNYNWFLFGLLQDIECFMFLKCFKRFSITVHKQMFKTQVWIWTKSFINKFDAEFL